MAERSPTSCWKRYNQESRIAAVLITQSRVANPGLGERNFHIFYQITKAASQAERDQFGMMPPQSFRYLSSSGEYNADGIDDAQEYKDMRHAMSVCNITADQQNIILEIVAAVLHLGNIEFAEEGNDARVDVEQCTFLLLYVQWLTFIKPSSFRPIYL